MSTGAKIAIGCAVAAVLAGIVALVAVGGAVWWAKDKVETVAREVAGDQERIDELHRQANANPFERPADGAIQEPRLLKFLQVRRSVYGVYQKHREEIEARGQKETADFADLTRGLSVINEIRLAQAEALASAGMSEDEYRYLVENVYKTLWASQVAEATSGKSVSEATEESMQRSAEALAQNERALEDAPPELREQMKTLMQQMQEGAAAARENAQALDVPPENIALFKKYEAEIKQYAMGGLELLGL